MTRVILGVVLAVAGVDAGAQDKSGDRALRARIRAEIGAATPGGRIGILAHVKACPICKRGFRQVALRESPTIEGPFRLFALVCEKDGLYFVRGQGGMTLAEGGPFALPRARKKGAPRRFPMPFGARRILPRNEKFADFKAVVRGADLRWAAGGGHDSVFRVWCDREVVTDRGTMGVTATAFAPGDEAIAVARSGGMIRVYGLPDGKKRGEFRGPFENVSSLTFDGRSRRLAVLSSAGTEPRLVICDARKGTVLRRLHADSAGGPTASAWSPDGRILVIGDHSGHVRLWSVATGTLIRRTRVGRQVHHVQFSRKGDAVAVLTDRGAKVEVLDSATGRPLVAFDSGTPLPHAAHGLAQLAFAKGGKHIAWLRADGLMFLGDIAKRRITKKSLGAANLSYFRLATDGATAITGWGDEARVHWDLNAWFPVGG